MKEALEIIGTTLVAALLVVIAAVGTVLIYGLFLGAMIGIPIGVVLLVVKFVMGLWA